MSKRQPIELAFEHLPVAALVVDEKRRVLAMNKEARLLTASSLSAAPIGATCHDLTRCHYCESHCPVQKAFSLQRPVHRTETRMSLSNGPGKVIERANVFRDPKTGAARAILILGEDTAHFQELRRLRLDGRRDGLTGVFNRNYFEAVFQQASGNERRHKPSAFLMIDVDGLKKVNDHYGHAAGDRLLKRLGRVLRTTTRLSDLVGRLGGDEFGVYCPKTTAHEAQELTSRIRQAIRKDNAAHPALPPLHIGVGIASSVKDGFQYLREKADARLCLYKQSRFLSQSLGEIVLQPSPQPECREVISGDRFAVGKEKQMGPQKPCGC